MSSTSMRRSSFSGPLTAVGGVSVLILGLAAIDERVRGQIVTLFNGGGPTGELASVGRQAERLASTVLQAVQYQSIEHAPLVIFALAAMVLVLFMLRT
jgi:hypothetical protein